jgi:hypothetical protein
MFLLEKKIFFQIGISIETRATTEGKSDGTAARTRKI